MSRHRSGATHSLSHLTEQAPVQQTSQVQTLMIGFLMGLMKFFEL